jgi:hypothetical protein
MGTDIDTIYISGEGVTPMSTGRVQIQSSAPGDPVCSLAGHGAQRVPAERCRTGLGHGQRSSKDSEARVVTREERGLR